MTTDPDKRITIKDIKKHPWFNLVTNTLSEKPGIMVGVDPTPFDPDIIKKMDDKFKIDT